MLKKFQAAKTKEIMKLRELQDSGEFPHPFDQKRTDFKQALKSYSHNPAVIAEFKQASPSKGKICDFLSVEEVVDDYTNNGADALSILTEKDYFAGDSSFISRAYQVQGALKKPILRKDFIFDPIQIDETAATPASAILLIVRICPDSKKLRAFRERAEKYGLSCVVEVFNEEDLFVARDSGASIIQVNARDLDTLRINREACLSLIKKHPPINEECWIAASGMDSQEHLRQAKDAGYDAALLGTALMKNGTPGETLRSLLGR